MSKISVKPLAWTKKPPPGQDYLAGSIWAVGIGGHYHIDCDGLLWMAHDPFVWQQHKDGQAAKAAAEADHARRVAMLVNDPDENGETNAAATAATLLAEANKLRAEAKIYDFRTCAPKHRAATAAVNRTLIRTAVRMEQSAASLLPASSFAYDEEIPDHA